MKEAAVERALGEPRPTMFVEKLWLFFACSPLTDWRWFRKLLGGKWVLWWIDVPVASFIWRPDDGDRMPLGTICGREDWP